MVRISPVKPFRDDALCFRVISMISIHIFPLYERFNYGLQLML
jgi:hypothetical protein